MVAKEAGVAIVSKPSESVQIASTARKYSLMRLISRSPLLHGRRLLARRLTGCGGQAPRGGGAGGHTEGGRRCGGDPPHCPGGGRSPPADAPGAQRRGALRGVGPATAR